MSLTMVKAVKSAREALDWMEEKRQSVVLFRGQNRIWPTIKPSITRDDCETRAQMWTIVPYFCAGDSLHVTGWRIPGEHNRLSVLQHYLGRSPMVDLTGSPLVALYFSLNGAQPGDECVVYAINQDEAAGSDVVFSGHAFLALPLGDGGTMHRWLRQDAYSVGPRACTKRETVERFDMLKLPGVDGRTFLKQATDDALVMSLGDLESLDDDRLARCVGGSVQAIAKSFALWDDPAVRNVIESSAMVNVDAEQSAEIEHLIDWAERLGADEQASQLRELKRLFVEGWEWNTSHTAALQVIGRRLAAIDCAK